MHFKDFPTSNHE